MIEHGIQGGSLLPGKRQEIFGLTPKDLIITSHSIDNLFDYCPRKFEFVSTYTHKPVDTESGYAADVGTALHRGTQAWLMAKHDGASEEDARIVGSWAFVSSFPWLASERITNQTRGFENACMILDMCWSHPFWDEWELVKIRVDGEERWAVEVPWVLIHKSFGPTNDGRYFATQGTVDFVMRNRLSGKICSIDMKTTIYERNLSRALYKYSGQQVGYGQVVEALLGRVIEELTVYYFVARFSSTEPSIEILDFVKTREDLEDYWLDKVDRLDRMMHMVNAQRFVRNNGGCFSYNYECQFFDICGTRDRSMVEAWFQDTMNAVPRTHPDWWIRLEI